MADDKSPGLPQLGQEMFQMVVGYAKQETVEPIRGLGRYVGFGLAGAFLIGFGMIFMAVGVLRLLQHEISWFDNSGWQSTFPYFIVVLALGLVIGLAGYGITRKD
ncbi:MAG: phage holin family protein [Actinomycetia bacterium]|nr:phage holin family protein [Actinomycetes bacterium]